MFGIYRVFGDFIENNCYDKNMIKIRQDKHGYYFIRYTHQGKRPFKSFGPSEVGKRAAELEVSRINLNIANKKMGVVEDVSAEEFFAHYLEYAEANKARSSYERDLLTIGHFTPVFQGKKLSQIGVRDVERYKNRRAKEVAKSTVNRELNTILAAFNRAVEWNYLSDNPFKSIKKFKEPKKAPRFFSHQEIEKMLRTASQPRLRNVILVLLHTGMRRDELVHLEWTDIDLHRKVLSVWPKADWHPKDYEHRSIPINKQLREVFLTLPKEGRYVFDGGDGQFYCVPSSLSRAFVKVLRRAGIPGANLHTLRHTYASHLVMAGVDLATVQKLLGHSQINTTMRYAHLASEHLHDAADKLGQSFAQLSVNPQSNPPNISSLSDYKN